MSDQIKSPGRKPASYFSQADQKDKLWRAEIEKERAESLAKTAKLRALRLAKEAADREAQEKPAVDGTARNPRNDGEARRRKRIMKY
jgi:hypothetical protein